MFFKPKINFGKMRVEALDQAAENVLTKMTGNELFPNPVPALSVLETDLADYRAAVSEAILGGKRARTVRDQVRTRLQNTLRSLAYSVQQVAMGDAAVILSAGFDHNKAWERHGNCPRPMNFRAVSGPLGSRWVKLFVRPERTARSCRFGYRLAGSTSGWIEISSNAFSRRVEGLQQFVEYEFRCTYVGTNPDVLNYSDVAVATVI